MLFYRTYVGRFSRNKCWFRYIQRYIPRHGWAILKMFEWWIQYYPGSGRGRSEIHPRDRNRFPKTDQWAVPAPHTSGTLGPWHVCAQRSNASYVTDWFYVKEHLYNGVDVWRRRGKWLENNESKASTIHCRALCVPLARFFIASQLRAFARPKIGRLKFPTHGCGNSKSRYVHFFRERILALSYKYRFSVLILRNVPW